MAHAGLTYYFPVQQVDTLANTATSDVASQAPADSAAAANFLYIPPHFTIDHETQEHALIAGKSLDDLINELKNVKPNPHKNLLEPISNAWPESVKTVSSVESFEKTYIPKKIDTYTNLGLFLMLLVFFILACERIAEGSIKIMTRSFNLKRMREMEGDSAMQTSRNLTAVFGTCLLAFILANQNINYGFMGEIPVAEAFGLIVVSTGIYVILKSWILTILDYVNESSSFRLINKFGRTYFAMAIIFMLAGEVIFSLFQDISANYIIWWIAISCAVPTLLYLNMERRIMFQNRFSVFTYILYLCTVEILPIVLIVKTI
ncbi:MAG: DUF4271 domain-containing protein [Bacteroidales bacterium]|jgi:hypothetical protein|nr:DUF4271 domain-containing protein [Bacteroidales bacterium]MCI1732760.1 DUF4271 domain-containing protein [Bacteroidales bacterium]